MRRTTMYELSRLVVVASAALAGSVLAPASIAAPLDPMAYLSQGDLSVSTGAVVFDTDTLQVTGGGAGVLNTTGVFQPQGVGQPSIAVFDFSNVLIGAGATIQVIGSNPIAILSQGNLVIIPAIDLAGAAGATGANAPATPPANNGQDGVANGFSGGGGAPAPLAEFPGGRGGDGGYNNGTGQTGGTGFGGTTGGLGGRSSGNLFDISEPGQPGFNGGNGFSGTPGDGGSSDAVAGPSFFLPARGDATAGTQGAFGKGGGGGGGGGGGSAGSGLFTGIADRGGGGGSGGNGGAGGVGGGAGLGGGAIEIGAVGSATLAGGVVASGGNGGNGGDGAAGSAGGTGGLGADVSGPGGKGGNGGAGGFGGPGGGGAGGAVFLHSAATSINFVAALGGIGGVNNAGGIASHGDSGLLKLTGASLFNVTGYTPGAFDTLSVLGRLDIDGTVMFAFSSDELAADLSMSATIDSFFLLNGAPMPDIGEFSDVTFTGHSPSNIYDVILNADRTFTVTAVPEPAIGIGAMLLIAGGIARRRARGRVAL